MTCLIAYESKFSFRCKATTILVHDDEDDSDTKCLDVK